MEPLWGHRQWELLYWESPSVWLACVGTTYHQTLTGLGAITVSWLSVMGATMDRVMVVMLWSFLVSVIVSENCGVSQWRGLHIYVHDCASYAWECPGWVFVCTGSAIAVWIQLTCQQQHSKVPWEQLLWAWICCYWPSRELLDCPYGHSWQAVAIRTGSGSRFMHIGAWQHVLVVICATVVTIACGCCCLMLCIVWDKVKSQPK